MNTKQSAHDVSEYEKGYKKGYEEGSVGLECCVQSGKADANYLMAEEMRVLFCALITAHKVNDYGAFYATIEIVKKTLAAHIKYEDKHWDIFRTDKKHTAKQKEQA